MGSSRDTLPTGLPSMAVLDVRDERKQGSSSQPPLWSIIARTCTERGDVAYILPPRGSADEQRAVIVPRIASFEVLLIL